MKINHFGVHVSGNEVCFIKLWVQVTQTLILISDQMQGMADQLVSKEEEFKEWQTKVRKVYPLIILSNIGQIKINMLIFLFVVGGTNKS